MSEFATRSTHAAPGYSGGGYARQEPVHIASPAEVARDSVVELERDARDVHRRIDALRAAHEANDPEKWSEARGRLETAIREAQNARDRAGSREADMDAKTRTRVDVAEHELAQLEATAATLKEPPKGFVHVHGESEIEHVLAAPLEGGAAAGNKRKEAELRELFVALSPSDSRALADRLRRNRPHDPLAKAFVRMTVDRRQRLLRVLDEAPRRAAIRQEAELRAGSSAPQTTEHHVDIEVLEHPHFEVTEIGSISNPIQVSFVVHSDEPVMIHSFGVETSDPARAAEIDVSTRARGSVLHDGETLTIDVAFRPTKPEALHAYLMFHGHTATRLVKKGTLLTAPTPTKAVKAHAEQNELALAERASRDLDGTATPSTVLYSEMLAAVLAAQRLTDHEQRDGAKRLLEPVDQRLEQLDGVAYQKLHDFGFANEAGHAIFDHAKSAIREWIAKVKLGSTIVTAPLVLAYRAGAEAIKLCTGEDTTAKNLREFDRAGRKTMKWAAVIAAAPALLAVPELATMALEEAGLLGYAVQSGARSLGLWALSNPAGALAVSEALIGFGIQIGEDGWDAFAAQLDDPRGRLFIVMQIMMDAMHVHAAIAEPRAPRSTGLAHAADEPGVSTLAPETVATVRNNVQKARAVLGDAVERANNAAAHDTASVSTPVHGADDAHAAAQDAHQPAGGRARSAEPVAHDTSELTSQNTTGPATTARQRVTEPVQGLYGAVKTGDAVGGLTLTDQITVEKDGTKVVETFIETPNGKSGYLERAYDPASKKLVMRNAFLDDVPRWINETGPRMDAKDGVPTVTYLTLRQMKLLGVDYSGLETIKMSTIQNVRGVIEFNELLHEGVQPDAAILKTHSVQYAEGAIVQSGHRVTSARWTPKWKTPLRDMLAHYETAGGRQPPDPTIVAKHDRLIAQYGKGLITRDTEVEWNYDIELDVAPFGK